jgi:hypothetical protein
MVFRTLFVAFAESWQLRQLKKMSAKKLLLVCLLPVISLVSVWGQNGASGKSIQVKRTVDPIVLDGKLEEASWFTGQGAVDFWQYFPTDSTLNDPQTEVYMAYDDKYLYIGAKCYSPTKDYVVPSLRRDYSAGGNDNLTFLIDPFQDRTNAFVFGMNPLGVMREALISNGGRNGGDWDSSWDNKWKGISHIGEGYWSCELKIPFSTLRFKEGESKWYFNSYRFDTQSGTRSSWNRIPQNQTIMSLAFMSEMIWEEPLQKPGKNISVIPYLTGSFNQNYEEGEPEDYDFGIGGDAKVAVTSGLNLDLTYNPDFSQVDVDRQVINTDRFEIFFPEQRQFFLENADLFSRFGDGSINPFFSRRIGSARVIDSEGEESTIGNPIIYGARLSGKLDNNWRLGILNMQTERNPEFNLPSYNYTVASVQRKLFSRSNIGFIFVNKQALTDTDSSEFYSPYNRVMGLDYNIASSDNRWVGKVFYHQAITTSSEKEKFAHGTNLEYRVRPYSVEWQHQYVGAGYDAETGFVRRTNYFRISPRARLFFYPSNGQMTEHGPGVEFTMLTRPGFGRSDHQIELFYNMEFKNTSRIRLTIQNEFIHLFDPFDPTRTDALELPEDSNYTYSTFRASYNSDRRAVFSYEVRPSIGQFFNGYRFRLQGSFNFRYQPLGLIALSYNYNYIDLPAPYATANLFLIGPRIDLTFSKNIFLTTFVQYNSQADNVNINTRFQWRFAPVSDFFLVYTDNYTSDNFNVKTRSIVAKLTYWLNL